MRCTGDDMDSSGAGSVPCFGDNEEATDIAVIL